MSVYYENGNEITDANNFALINPIRYRGYYYDSETGFYYLKSRYYDPANCRFISADTRIDLNFGTTNLNLFAYCGNDPVNRVDPSGEDFFGFLEELFTNIGNAINGMVPAYAGCGTVAVADGPFMFGDLLALAGGAVITATAVGIGLYNTFAKSKAETKAEVKEKEKTASPPVISQKYYHITSPQNAMAIKESGLMAGNPWEANLVFAFKRRPGKYAMKNAGAHKGVIISFKTTAAFETDPAFEKDPIMSEYLPVRTVFPGPIKVTDVEIDWG